RAHASSAGAAPPPPRSVRPPSRRAGTRGGAHNRHARPRVRRVPGPDALELISPERDGPLLMRLLHRTCTPQPTGGRRHTAGTPRVVGSGATDLSVRAARRRLGVTLVPSASADPRSWHPAA